MIFCNIWHNYVKSKHSFYILMICIDYILFGILWLLIIISKGVIIKLSIIISIYAIVKIVVFSIFRHFMTFIWSECVYNNFHHVVPEHEILKRLLIAAYAFIISPRIIMHNNCNWHYSHKYWTNKKLRLTWNSMKNHIEYYTMKILCIIRM